MSNNAGKWTAGIQQLVYAACAKGNKVMTVEKENKALQCI